MLTADEAETAKKEPLALNRESDESRAYGWYMDAVLDEAAQVALPFRRRGALRRLRGCQTGPWTQPVAGLRRIASTPTDPEFPRIDAAGG